MTSTMIIIYIVFIAAIFYFLLIRPQKKQKQQRGDMLSQLQMNDEVYTVGGILGTITRIKTNTVWLRVSDKVEIEVLKTSIGGLKEKVEAQQEAQRAQQEAKNKKK
ncbi:MAG: preprotein translocase subunit YajC [Bacillota bacterium]